MLTEKEKEDIFKTAYHWKYEDNMPWNFVTGMVNQDLGTSYSAKEVEKVCKGKMKK